MGESALSTIVNAAPFWGPLTVILLAAIVALYRRNNTLNDKLLEFAVKSIESDKDNRSALDRNSDASRQIADAMNRIADRLSQRP